MPDLTPGAAVVLDTSISAYVQTQLVTVSDADGGRPDLLQEIWNRGDIDNLVLCVVGVFPTSSGGSYSLTGRTITPTDPGMPFPAGGVWFNIMSAQDVRNFRMQATAGGTVTLVAVGYR